MLDLPTTVRKLHINSYISNKLKVSTFIIHTEITSLTVLYRNTQINPGMFYLLPKSEILQMSSVYFVYFPYFAYANRFLTYLHITEFGISSTSAHIITRDHVSGLKELKHLRIIPNQHLNTTDR